MARAISDETWRDLVTRTQVLADRGAAEDYVFATAVGPRYQVGAAGTILYAGKSAGPLGHKLGHGYDHHERSQASQRWMIERWNPSAFWHFVDRIVFDRGELAWTNLVKADRRGGGSPPPRNSEWSDLRKVCMTALKEEIISLRPHVTLFVTGSDGADIIDYVISELEYRAVQSLKSDTRLFETSDGRHIVVIGHPQGKSSAWLAEHADLVQGLLSS